MRSLTFNGFLKQYVRKLSTQDTLGIHKLAKEAEHENPRLREPLAIYALFNGKVDILFGALKDDWLDDNIFQYSNENFLSNERSNIPENYKKVYRSYLSVSAKKHADDHTKTLLHKRIREMQEEKQISNYKLYNTLNLNPGNANAFLKYCDTSKVSLETARKMFDIAKAIQ